VKERLLEIFMAGVRAADPRVAVSRHMRVEGGSLYLHGEKIDLSRFKKVVVVGAGKGASPMAKAAEESLGDRIDEGVVVVKYGHATERLSKIAQVEASHPLPDESGVRGTGRIIELLKGADSSTLVVCLLSGGASSLLVAPVDGVSLEDKRRTTAELLACGASIGEVNAVRKHLSRVKGGRLAELASPATVLTFIMSDVIGDRLDVIASGPTVPDGSTFAEAIEVVERYAISGRLPESVAAVLKAGAEGKLNETPKASEPFFKYVRSVVVGSLGASVAAAKDAASVMGFEAEIATSELQGEAREAARLLASSALEARDLIGDGGKPRCFISGGETTVTIKGGGKGGRNQELALAFAIEIEGKEGITMLSAGTDGTDGPTDAAGAVVDGATVTEARRLGIDPADYLERNDSYAFFERLDAASASKSHIKTGPTGTNVMDIQITVVEGGP